MRLRTLCAMAAAIVAAVGFSTHAHASILGVATDFNGFVFSNLSSAGADTEGRLAVGGNFTASNYGVGSGGVGPALPNSHGTRNDLIVGGNMNAIGGWQVFYGNAVWGTGLTAAPTTPNGTTFQGTPVDFAAAKADLTAKSAFWSTLATNASVIYDGYSTLTLTATNAGLNVFNVSEAVWEATSSKQIVNPFPNATLLINIAGVNVTQFGGLSYNGSGSPSAAHSGVLFNYADALTLQNNHIAMLGSVLAPNADLTLNGGGINGNGIANNVLQQNGGEFHNFKFTGDLPNVTPVPEPSSVVVAGMLLAMGAFAGRRHLAA
jgi:choice-of-anchor A domain-containing protein